MLIKEVETNEEASICDELLTKLIEDEKKYNDNIGGFVAILDYYPNIYNKEDNKLFIAKDNDKVVGYIYIKKESTDGLDTNKEYLIDALYVEEEYRNKGIATSLINKVKDYCKDNNIKYLNISVIDSNEKAKSLYSKLGFEVFSLKLKNKVM